MNNALELWKNRRSIRFDSSGGDSGDGPGSIPGDRKIFYVIRTELV